jgi:Fic family protein
VDSDKFGPSAPGTIVKIEGGEAAFVPNALPVDGWKLAVPTWQLLAEAMHQLGRLDGVATSLPEPGILIRPLENREALRSSSLEGTYATPRELLLFDLQEAEPQGNVDPTVQGWREVHNYRRALSTSHDIRVADSPLVFIRQLHHVLLTNVRGSGLTPGAFRTRQVYIGSDHRFTPPPPTHVQGCLEDFERFVRSPDRSLPPLVRAFLAHYQFETIHPFLDGNGRVGRLLMTLMIRELCDHRRPWLYLSAYFDRYKDEYINRLFAVSAEGAWDAWLDFCLKATIAQATDTFDRCTKLLSLREEYRAKVAKKPRLSNIVDMLFKNPFTQIASLTRSLGVSYPTAQNDVEQLVHLGILEELQSDRPRTHYAPGIYNITFEEPAGTPSAET